MTTLIALMMSLVLTACAAAPMANIKNDPPPRAEEESLRFVLDTVTLEDTALAEDGTPLASYHFELPELTVLGPDGRAVTEPKNDREQQAVDVAAVFNTRFEDWAAAEDFQQVVGFAAEEYAWFRSEGLEWPGGDEQGPGGYMLELTCESYQTDRLISISATYYSNTGGAHPNIWLLSWNFDLTTGAFFSPELLAASGPAFLEAVEEELVRQSRSVAAENDMTAGEYFWPDYTAAMGEWSSYSVSFDEEGMTVAFSPYELASYAAGPQVFRLSCEWLRPYLSAHGLEVLGLEETVQ